MTRPKPESGITRRRLLGAAAGGAAAVATQGLPAWARPASHRHHRLIVRRPDSLPFPHLPAGTPSMPQIRHIVVLIMENHSFDSFLGAVPHQVRGRRALDGLTFKHGRATNGNRDIYG